MDILDLLRVAIQTEIATYELYHRGAQGAGDEKLRAMFEQLAQEELKHKELLQNQYQLLAGDVIQGID